MGIKAIANLAGPQKLAIAVLSTFCLLSIFIAAITYKYGVGFGDPSLFYAFASNIVSGEAIYSDFIHFRTPGSYFLYSIFVMFFGDQYSSVNLGIIIESGLLYATLLLGCICILFWKQKILPWLVGIVAFGMLLYPVILQVRSGIALLAVVLYTKFAYKNNPLRRWLLTIGALVGACFLFGQEMALLPIVVIGSIELTRVMYKQITIRALLRKLMWLVLGCVLTIIPPMVYFMAASDVGNFFYYTIYYAFILQPQGMDIAFPALSNDTMIYYSPLLMLVLAYGVLQQLKSSKQQLIGMTIVTFVSVRMISFFGRTDIPHLLFAASELYLLVPLTAYWLYTLRKDHWVFSLRLFMFLGVYTVLLLVATQKSFVVALLPFIIAIDILRPERLKIRKSTKEPIKLAGRFTYVVTCFMVIFPGVWISYELRDTLFMSKPKQMKHIIQGSTQEKLVYENGSWMTALDADRVRAVELFLEENPSSTIFSFPQQPYYYSLAEEHASRFMSFEPQTTESEQNQTIEDLKESQPGLVILDPLQAGSLSGSVSKISQHILNNYETKEIIIKDSQLWLMTRRQTPLNREYLAMSLYQRITADTANNVTILHNPEVGLINALLVNDSAVFNVEKSITFKTGLSTVAKKDGSLDTCGLVIVSNGDDHNKHRVCENDGLKSINLQGASSVRLEPASKSEAVFVGGFLE